MAKSKNAVEKSTPEERIYLSAFLKHLVRKDDPTYQADLGRLIDEIDCGKKFELNQVKKLHESLKSVGL